MKNTLGFRLSLQVRPYFMTQDLWLEEVIIVKKMLILNSVESLQTPYIQSEEGNIAP